jgi:hypothetical protein
MLSFSIVVVISFGYGVVIGHSVGYEKGKQTRTKE